MRTILHSIRFFALSLLVFAVGLLVGCRSNKRSSNYWTHHAGSSYVQFLPDMSEIQELGLSVCIQRPTVQVYDALRDVSIQYDGLLVVKHDKTGRSVRMLINRGVPSKAMDVASGITTRTVRMRCEDHWLAVALSPHSAGTRMDMAWISPETGRIEQMNIPINADCTPSSLPISSLQSGIDRFIAAYKQVEYELIHAKDAEEEQKKYTQYLLVESTIWHLGSQLYGPPEWIRKISGSRRTPRAAVDVQFEAKPEWSELRYEYGNWLSMFFQQTMVTIECPEVETELSEIVNELLVAAGRPDLKYRVFVVSDPSINAWVVSNGDVYICAGALDEISSRDEIAAILAHEMDHALNDDAVREIKKRAQTEAVVGTVVYGTSIASLGAATVTLAAGANAATSASTIGGITQAQSMLQTSQYIVISSQANLLAGTIQGPITAANLMSGYSQEVELRADRNGMRYLWAAGYDYRATISLLQRLLSLQVAAAEGGQQHFGASGYMNCKPGLEKRIENLQAETFTNSP